MRILSIWLLTLVFFINVSLPAYSQSRFSDNLYIKAAYRPGIVLPEYSLFTYLVDDYIRGGSISISKHADGDSYWAQLFNYPEYGLTVQYSTLGNDAVFGNETSLYPFVSIPIIRSNWFTLQNQLGMGLGFTSKVYDPETNPMNVAVGTHLNIHFNFELNATLQWHPRMAVYTGVCFDHLSNGNLGEPNLGINAMTFNAGVRYLAGQETEKQKHDLPPFIRSTRYSAIVSMGAKHARALQSESYFVSSLSFECKAKLFRIFYPGIGADLFYDGSTQEEIRAFGDNNFTAIDNFKSGIHLTQELVYNKFSIAVQEGFYLGLSDKAFQYKTYHRFIVRHQVGKRLFAQIALKAHVVVLDYLEFGAGYLIKP